MQTYVVRARDHQGNHEHTADVEDEDTEERPADSNRDILSWGLGLADRDTDELRADVRKQRVRQSTPEAQEDGEMDVVHFREEIGAHGSIRVLPVAEAVTVMFWVTAEIDDDTHEDEPNKGNDFYAAEPELEFSEDTNTEHIDDEDCEGKVEYV